MEGEFDFCVFLCRWNLSIIKIVLWWLCLRVLIFFFFFGLSHVCVIPESTQLQNRFSEILKRAYFVFWGCCIVDLRGCVRALHGPTPWSQTRPEPGPAGGASGWAGPRLSGGPRPVQSSRLHGVGPASELYTPRHSKCGTRIVRFYKYRKIPSKCTLKIWR